MKRTPIKQKSHRQLLIETTEDVLRAVLKLERGDKCEVCSRTPVGMAHTLLKGPYPRMRFHRANIFLLCWGHCHSYWHHDRSDPRAKRIEQLLIDKYGPDWELELKAINAIQPRLTDHQIYGYFVGFGLELEQLKERIK